MMKLTSVRRIITSSSLSNFRRNLSNVHSPIYLHLDDAFARAPLLPPRAIIPIPAPRSRSASLASDNKYRLRLATGKEKTLHGTLHRLAVDLHWCHRERIRWPAEDTIRSSTYVRISPRDISLD